MRITKEMLPEVARAVIAHLTENKSGDVASVLALSGDLGAGKTALVQAISKELGVSITPTSPTFVIMRSYTAEHPHFSKLVHIDAYRLESELQAGPLHLDQIFKEKDTLVCIEWPEKLGAVVPKNALSISLVSAGENERELQSWKHLEDALQKYIKVV